MDENDLNIARALERQILKEKRLLSCGCSYEAKYGHPTQPGWVLVNDYLMVCPTHTKVGTHFDSEKKQQWGTGQFMPKWRDCDTGLWVLQAEWQNANFLPSISQKGAPSWIPGPAVIAHDNVYHLLLVGYLGTPVVLGPDKHEKMRGRAICLSLETGKTVPLKVSEDMMMRFGWRKEG